MTPEEVAAFLDEQRVLNVATNGPRGYPHVVAMWFVMDGGRPTFWTFGKSQKIANLRRDSKITGLVESGEAYSELRGVEVTGRAQLIEDYDAVLDVGIKVAEKYNGPQGAGELARPFLEKQAHKRIGVAIDVEDVVSWDHRKISGY